MIDKNIGFISGFNFPEDGTFIYKDKIQDIEGVMNSIYPFDLITPTSRVFLPKTDDKCMKIITDITAKSLRDFDSLENITHVLPGKVKGKKAIKAVFYTLVEALAKEDNATVFFLWDGYDSLSADLLAYTHKQLNIPVRIFDYCKGDFVTYDETMSSWIGFSMNPS